MLRSSNSCGVRKRCCICAGKRVPLAQADEAVKGLEGARELTKVRQSV